MNRTLYGSTANGMMRPTMPSRPMMPPRIGLPQRPGSVIPRPGPAMRQPMGGLQAFDMAGGGIVNKGARWLADVMREQTFAPTDAIARNARLRRHGMTMDEGIEGRFKGFEPMSSTIRARDPEAFDRAAGEIDSLAQEIARKRRGYASGGYASGGHPEMSWIAIRDALRSMPNRTIPDYLLAGMAEGGNTDEIVRATRRRHGIGRGFSGIDREAPMRTMLQNDPISYWDESIPSRYNLWKFRRPSRGVEMSPDRANEITQNAIDTVHGPGRMRQIIEGLLGDSPGSAALGVPGKGWLPSARMSGLGAMLYSGDAGAGGDELRPRDYESYQQWQPFRRVDEAIR